MRPQRTQSLSFVLGSPLSFAHDLIVPATPRLSAVPPRFVGEAGLRIRVIRS
jgi:hypothetical protein